MQSQTGELTYVKVDADNISSALDIQHLVWPHEDADRDYLSKLSYPDDPDNVSWLVYHDSELIGIVGIFAFDSDEPGYDHGESIWLDWFALLPQFRHRGFGGRILQDVIWYCRSLGRFKYLRLDTTYYPDRPALFLYDKIMDLCEDYTAEDTSEIKHHYLIYSYSLDGLPVRPWNNHFLALDGLDEETK